MKLFVVEYNIEYEPGTILGIFSSREAAEAICGEDAYWGGHTVRWYSVEEFTLDEEADNNEQTKVQDNVP
jgi:hypothetical protein